MTEAKPLTDAEIAEYLHDLSYPMTASLGRHVETRLFATIRADRQRIEALQELVATNDAVLGQRIEQLEQIRALAASVASYPLRNYQLGGLDIRCIICGRPPDQCKADECEVKALRTALAEYQP